jgi:hypothetical protein
VLQGLPNDSNQFILVGHLGRGLMPLNEVNGVVDEEPQEVTELRDETLNARGAEDRERASIFHLGPHHQQAGDTEAMVAVEMAYSQNPERLDAQSRLLEVDLTALHSFEEINLSLEPHRQRGEKPVRHRHHPAGT